MRNNKLTKIGLAIENRVDISIFRKLLVKEYNIEIIKKRDNLNSDYDLIIINKTQFINFFEQIKSVKNKIPPLFLPIVLSIPHNQIASISDKVWEYIDEIIPVPAHKNVLLQRIKSLLKTREQSLKLYEANSAKNMLFSIVAHDLRGPMATLSLILRLYKKGKYNETQIRVYLDNLEQDVTNLSELLNNVLKWAESQMERIICNPEDFNIRERIDACINLFKDAAENKGVELRSLINQSFIINADKDLFDIIIRNLLSNAVKFTPNGGIVSVSAENSGAVIKITVSDTGIGMDENEINKLLNYNIYYTKNGTAGERGAGLGFQLCSDFVKMCGGTINVYSKPGEGSEFIITLPVSS
ncbi:MAG: HAMP domain-containing sensor histidine kinase [Thermodesulfobacteriota bacterium]|nr:HAMP domain-containing sensor histidine kinase [Thermodesulfobacteriota bacterium]